MERVLGVLLAAGAVVLGLLALAAGLQLAGYEAAAALTAMWRGAFGSWYAITSATLVRSVPLIVIGLGIALAFRAGAFNIGAEGQFYAGAIAATWIGLHAAGLPAPLALAAAARRRGGRGGVGGAAVLRASDTASPKSSPR
jgi:simple sugar transport system permease protein